MRASRAADVQRPVPSRTPDAAQRSGRSRAPVNSGAIGDEVRL